MRPPSSCRCHQLPGPQCVANCSCMAGAHTTPGYTGHDVLLAWPLLRLRFLMCSVYTLLFRC